MLRRAPVLVGVAVASIKLTHSEHEPAAESRNQLPRRAVAVCSSSSGSRGGSQAVLREAIARGFADMNEWKLEVLHSTQPISVAKSSPEELSLIPTQCAVVCAQAQANPLRHYDAINTADCS